MQQVITKARPVSISLTRHHRKSKLKKQYQYIQGNLAYQITNTAGVIIGHSAIRKEKKSGTSLYYLAQSYAEAGNRVLVVGLNTHKQSFSSLVQVTKAAKLHLLFNQRLQDLIFDLPGVDFSYLQVEHPPQKAWKSWMANEFIQSLRSLNESYDVILLDLPPILVESLTQKLADKLDGVVVVLQEGRTKKPDIEETDALLKQAKTKNMGFIFQR